MTAKLRLVIDNTKEPQKNRRNTVALNGTAHTYNENSTFTLMRVRLSQMFVPLLRRLTAPRFFEFPQFGTTELEKRQYILHHLTIKFAEYQVTTGTVGLFPAIEAMNEVDKLEQQGRLNAYYRMLKRKIG